MQKIALITDSACDLDLNTLKENNINLLPLRIIYSNGDYRDRLDISPQEVYDNLEKEVPKTSLPSAQETEETLNKLEEEGYTHVICISISSGLSGSFNAIRLALEDHPKLTSFVYDSKILAYPQGEIVLEVAKLIKEGKSFEEIVQEIPEIRKRVIGYFTINTLEYLKKGGRVTAAGAAIGTVLNIKPVLQIQGDKLDAYAKARGVKQAKKIMLEAVKKDVETRFKDLFDEGRLRFAVVHSDNFEAAEEFMREVKEVLHTEDVYIDRLSLSVACHIGPGALAVACMIVE